MLNFTGTKFEVRRSSLAKIFCESQKWHYDWDLLLNFHFFLEMEKTWIKYLITF